MVVVGMNEVQFEALAAAIHESRGGVLPWDKLPASPNNPQRFYARQAATAVVKLFSPGSMDIEDVKKALSDTPTSAPDTAARYQMTPVAPDADIISIAGEEDDDD